MSSFEKIIKFGNERGPSPLTPGHSRGDMTCPVMLGSALPSCLCARWLWDGCSMPIQALQNKLAPRCMNRLPGKKMLLFSGGHVLQEDNALGTMQ